MIKAKSRDFKFLFINPPYERLKGLSLESIPMGLLYTATMLEREGYECTVYDADTDFYQGDLEYNNLTRSKTHARYIDNLNNENHPAWVETTKVLREYKPDFVGVTMMTPSYSSSQRIFKLVKKECPDAVLLAGGPHVTISKSDVLKSNPEVDFGFVGEAEESIIEFMNAFSSDKNFSRIEGLLYREGDDVCFTGIRSRIEDLDRIPIPDRKLLYYADKYHKQTLSFMVASRGCPFACTFCASVPLWGKKVKLRSPDNIVKEIDYLVSEYGIKTFGFWDDTFTTNKANVIDFCGRIKQKYGSTRFKWKCITNINVIDNELLLALKKSGCRIIDIGVESGSDRILRMIKKNITTDKVKEASRLIKKNGFWLHTFFMIGIPHEEEEDIRKTIDFMKEIRPDSVNLCTFTPWPGTELYNYVVQRGMFPKTDDFTVYDTIGHHSQNNFFVEHVSRERYLQLLDEILALSTSISRRLTLRKALLKRHLVTPEWIRRKIKRTFKMVLNKAGFRSG